MIWFGGSTHAQLPDVTIGRIQVRATEITALLPVENEFVTEVFTQRVGPTDLVEIPNGSNNLVVTTYGGVAFVMDKSGTLQSSPFLDLRHPQSPSFNPSFQVGDAQGFTSIAFHPQFSNRQSAGYAKFYTLEAESVNSGPHDFVESIRLGAHHDDVLYEYTLDSKDDLVCTQSCVSTKRAVMRVLQPGWHHNLGDLAFDNEGNLYIGSGDGSTSGYVSPFMSDNSQALRTIFGKILRIDPLGKNGPGEKYGIPESNPFVGKEGVIPEIYAYGLRNPYRISFDSQTGELYVSSTGEEAIESIYHIVPGGNHGWNLKEGSFVYDPATKTIRVDEDRDGSGVGDVAEANQLIEPILEYDRDDGRSIIGTVAYRGSSIPDLQGKIIFADFSGRVYYGDEESGITFAFGSPGNGVPFPVNIHSVNEDLDGNLYVLGIQPRLNDYVGVVLRLDALHPLGDCNQDGLFNANDLDCACSAGIEQLGVVLGDLDASGQVDFADFLILSSGFGQSGSYRAGDLNCDGHIGFSDFLLLSANFGRDGVSLPRAVPEPSSWLTAGVFLTARWRSRRPK